MRDFKHIIDTDPAPQRPRRRPFLAYIVILVVVTLVAVLSVRKGAQALSTWQQTKSKPASKEKARPQSLFSNAHALLPQATVNGERLTALSTDGIQYTYSIDPELSLIHI